VVDVQVNKMIKHPQYTSLNIYFGSKGEKARAGAFYVPTKGQTLSTIARAAYGSGKLASVLKINRSLWNIHNCVYRISSSRCTSAKVTGAKAITHNNWNDGAWLALCPKDRNDLAISRGFAYPVIWIPTTDGKEPKDFGESFTPGVGVGLGIGTGDGGGATVITSPGIGLGTGTGNGEPVEETPEMQKAGFPLWGIALAALGLGGAFIYYSVKKRKKGRR